MINWKPVSEPPFDSGDVMYWNCCSGESGLANYVRSEYDDGDGEWFSALPNFGSVAVTHWCELSDLNLPEVYE